MKSLLLILSWLILLPLQTFAQHCPFDGGNMIAVYVTDKNAKPISGASKYLKLVEINNPVADSCTYAQGLLQKNFLPTKEYLQEHYKNYWTHWIEPNYKDWELYNAGFYALTLNQAEESCMIKNNNDFKYRKREFEITYQKDGSKQTIKVPEDRIYSLCTDAGKWTRIVPIEIKTSK